VVEAGLVADVTQAEGSWADVLRAAELVAEDDPVAVWGQLVRIAETGVVRTSAARQRVAGRGELRLADLVGLYCRAVDDARADVPVAVAAGRRQPVESAASWACGAVRRGLIRGTRAAVEDETPTQESGSASSGAAGDQTVVSPEPLYVPEPEPERRLTAEERRAIRERVAAQQAEGGDPVAAEAPPPAQGPRRSLAARLEQARARRRRGR
jgi:hypothetical protein